jgi:glycosyltransferase involved in cell wall biosynthesis
VKFLFVGDGKLKPRLIERKEHESLDNCIFMDPLKKTELASIVASADVGLMILANVPAFYRGTSPNKFFDYLATGLPVLVNYPGWVAGIIEKEECGCPVSPDDPSAFADALIQLKEDPSRRKRMAEHSRRLAMEEFSRDRLSDQFAEFIEK